MHASETVALHPCKVQLFMLQQSDCGCGAALHGPRHLLRSIVGYGNEAVNRLIATLSSFAAQKSTQVLRDLDKCLYYLRSREIPRDTILMHSMLTLYAQVSGNLFSKMHIYSMSTSTKPLIRSGNSSVQNSVQISVHSPVYESSPESRVQLLQGLIVLKSQLYILAKKIVKFDEGRR